MRFFKCGKRFFFLSKVVVKPERHIPVSGSEIDFFNRFAPFFASFAIAFVSVIYAAEVVARHGRVRGFKHGNSFGANGEFAFPTALVGKFNVFFGGSRIALFFRDIRKIIELNRPVVAPFKRGFRKFVKPELHNLYGVVYGVFLFFEAGEEQRVGFFDFFVYIFIALENSQNILRPQVFALGFKRKFQKLYGFFSIAVKCVDFSKQIIARATVRIAPHGKICVVISAAQIALVKFAKRAFVIRLGVVRIVVAQSEPFDSRVVISLCFVVFAAFKAFIAHCFVATNVFRVAFQPLEEIIFGAIFKMFILS